MALRIAGVGSVTVSLRMSMILFGILSPLLVLLWRRGRSCRCGAASRARRGESVDMGPVRLAALVYTLLPESSSVRLRPKSADFGACFACWVQESGLSTLRFGRTFAPWSRHEAKVNCRRPFPGWSLKGVRSGGPAQRRSGPAFEGGTAHRRDCDPASAASCEKKPQGTAP